MLLLIVTLGWTENAAAFTPASCDAMLLRACDSHGSMFDWGFSTLKLLAANALYLASMSGPLLATSSGPLTSSPSARQYIRRNAGLLYIFAIPWSAPLNANRFCPGPQEPLFPSTMLKSNISSVYFVPSVPM